MRLTHGRAVLLMVVVTLMWSTAGVITRQLEQARSFEVTFWRSLFTLLSLLLILPLVQGRAVWGTLRHGGRALWLSGLCWSVMFTAFMVALTLTTVASVLITMALGPLITALIARLVFGYEIPVRTWLSIVAAGAGIAWMFGAQLGGGNWRGTMVAFAVPIGSAINWTVIQRSKAQGEQVDLVPAVMIGALLSAAATLPLALPFSASMRDLGLLAVLGLTQLAIPCSLAVIAASALKAPEMALLGLLEVVFGIALAWLGAGETPLSTTLAGGALVVGALVLNELLGWRSATARVASTH